MVPSFAPFLEFPRYPTNTLYSFLVDPRLESINDGGDKPRAPREAPGA